MSQLTGREPGVVGAALDDPDSWCGIIVDGRHVDPTVLRIALRCKRHDRFMLVTDAMPSVGASEKSFSLQGRTISVADGVLVDDNGTLAGSDTDMATAVRNAVELLGLKLPEAVRMASQYPAEFLGLGDELGRIAPGYRARPGARRRRTSGPRNLDRRADAHMTATLFNYSYHHTAFSGAPSSAATRAGIRSIVIVGGGTAGWMSAMILANALIKKGVEITLLESPSVEIIGVGEGSTPWLRGFFDSLGIEEAEWMPECNATYKCGITFDKWSTKPGFESYFHPFASMLDNLTMTQFVHNAQARLNGADVHAHPNRFFIATRLADARMAPIPANNFPFDVWYAYHFDAVLLGKYLHRKAVERGVRYKSCHLTRANLDERGDIASVSTQEGETIAADFFVDCTGFASFLIGKALETPFISFSSNLFNDAAVAMPTPMDESIPSQTVSTAMKHGWAWKIPLTSRYGNGYVYSSSFCSADQAEHELRDSLGLLRVRPPARHLKMRIGRGAEALEPELPRRGTVPGLHRAARSHRAALHPEDRQRHRRVPRAR